MDQQNYTTEFAFLKHSSARKRVESQQNAVRLLFENIRNGQTGDAPLDRNPLYHKLRRALSPATMLFPLSDLHKEIYHNDTGSAVVPGRLKSALLNLKANFVVRPGTYADLQSFVALAHREKLHYTIRAAGSWPFGGVLPMNNELILDLSYLDFHQLNESAETLTIGPGVLFANMRRFLKEHGFALRQEITNPNSGTICGWIATGGLGIGAYKYGHVKNSVEAIFMLKPDGEWLTLNAEDELFHHLFDSEGQIGIIAGVVLKVKPDRHVSKPYAFSFASADDVYKFVQLVREWDLAPTSMIYFDENYMQTTYRMQTAKHQKALKNALKSEDDLRIDRERHTLEVVEHIQHLQHVLVLEFDCHEDYERCLKHTFFSSRNEASRYRDINYTRLPAPLAHKLWEHRYAPVEMKSRGPSMLVSETVLPLGSFPKYVAYVESTISRWTRNPIKTEGHFLNSGEVLIQSILLADTNTWRHQIYLPLVPFMIQVSLFFGGKSYGTGIWNLPFLSGLLKTGMKEHILRLKELKRELDPQNLINQCKHINQSGRRLALRVYRRFSAGPLSLAVKLLHRGQEGIPGFNLNGIGRLVWKLHKSIFPRIVPPDIQAQRHPLAEINSACAECDSCERVCPTSDVFGLLGIATPITRRKTANRIVEEKTISQEEALGFLVCTRCDNCTRVCPTDIPLTNMFDMVEEDRNFKQALGLNDEQKKDFIERMWDIMKESPLYVEHTRAVQKEDRSHLQHGLKIHYPRGYAYSELFIDPETCIHCGMCAHENACIYGARQGNPREIPELIDENCALCNACINFCPQNKAVQLERDYIQDFVDNAVDMEEKHYWESKKQFIRDTTTIERSPQLTDMADIYVTEEILMEIDKEASTGQIPVSGMGQGDRHMGIGFDAERFSHFHIVGPAQNRLHEGDPAEELSVILGKRHRYCTFDEMSNLLNPPFPTIKLMTPVLFNSVRLRSNGRAELAFIKVAAEQKSLAVIKLNRILEFYDFFIEKGGYERLPRVVVPRVDNEMIDHLRISPNVRREMLLDLWQMPMFEITPHEDMEATIRFIKDSAAALHEREPLLCGYVDVSEYDIVAGEILPHLRQKIEAFMQLEVDALHINGLRNKDQYFVTSQAVRTIHHYLLDTGRRHQVSLLASGGIRLASDSQKTIQRGAEATLIDFAALLALDPYAYKATQEDKTTTEKLIHLDIDWAVQRLNNQMESRKIQVLEVLGASGFKDIKKTVGEEGRLIDFYELEERMQKNVFEHEHKIEEHTALNEALLRSESIPPGASPTYDELKNRIKPLRSPHFFYELGSINQTVYQRDHVWPGTLIRTIGRMAAGDPDMVYLKNVKSTGLLGDGFDVMKILYQRDPDIIPDDELTHISTALPLDKGLVLHAPWMFGGKSVGSIGLDSWRAHVIAVRELGIQYDTGEGGYPTCFFINRKGEPIFFTEPEIQLFKHHFEHDHHYTTADILRVLDENGITAESQPGIYKVLEPYPQLQPFLYYEVIGAADEPFISTELKTGLFGVTRETIKKARRVVIAYSQGAKMGIGGHILAGKVNKLVSYLRGIQGLEKLDEAKIRQLIEKIEKLEKQKDHPLTEVTQAAYEDLMRAHDDKIIYPELKEWLYKIQQRTYTLHQDGRIDPIEFEQVLRLSEDVISYAYTSVISPFPFHNCYSIEDVKSFIDMVRMINPQAVISVKVSPSVDIEFIAAGLARISRDNTDEVLKYRDDAREMSEALAEYVQKYGMKIEIWLDGPRGGTGASPNIIKGQMGMHIEYAIPLIHDRLVRDGLRNHVKFMVSGGIRTYEDVIKAVALGADGVIWGTAPLVAIGCDRNRNCHDGCSRGIATSNLIMQNLRDVELNSQQMINAFLLMQMQVIRALAGLGLSDIRQLRGRFDKIQWIGLKERVDFRIRQRLEHARSQKYAGAPEPRRTGQTNCGVAAIIGTHPVPSYILDEALYAMKNRGMDGVGVGKTLCFPEHPRHYAYRVMVKGKLQLEIETAMRKRNGKIKNEKEFRATARRELVDFRNNLAEIIRKVFLEPYFDLYGFSSTPEIREKYKADADGNERDYREFGNVNADPGDIYPFFVRVKKESLIQFIEEELLIAPKYEYIREYFPEVGLHHYASDMRFMRKSEDLFVFNHSVMLTQILYVWDVADESWPQLLEHNGDLKAHKATLSQKDPISRKSLARYGESYLLLMRRFAQQFPANRFDEKYRPRLRKIAAIMSCGMNFGVWKTAGREIPWETPAAPNNIIHVRLATGSVVEQMNAHPFAKLHTALTHNGETTNYETLKQRVEQFGLPPLASTDTEVASLKFHLLADELEYPDWALFESFSPTTGDDLSLIPPELRVQLEEVQRVEFTSSPDGPYQYLCLRHHPYENVTERVDLKDPADLRPGTSVFWYDTSGEETRAFSLIASEEQACQRILDLLDREGIIDGAEGDHSLVSKGMINRFEFDESGNVHAFQLIDRYGRAMVLPQMGKHYSYYRNRLNTPSNLDRLKKGLLERHHDLNAWIRESLPEWEFNTYRWVLEALAERSILQLGAKPDSSGRHLLASANLTLGPEEMISMLSYFIDYLRTMDTGAKAKSSLVDITRQVLYTFFDRLAEAGPQKWMRASIEKTDIPAPKDAAADCLLVDATGFEPEGINPDFAFAAFLSRAFDLGWRRFRLYRVNGQRLISTAVMGRNSVDADDVQIDVYGTPGEYFAAFNQGGVLRCHGNAQNFTAMGIHHGDIYVYGNAGKVCGYASKGGSINILGDIVDRAWTNSVNDPRCQELEVNILGSASKYCGESLMGGDFFFGGMYFDKKGNIRLQDRPYRGTKLLGGASRGNMLFFDPENRLDAHQHVHGTVAEITPQLWTYWEARVKKVFGLAGIDIKETGRSKSFSISGQEYAILPENFKLIIPKGGQKGYESH